MSGNYGIFDTVAECIAAAKEAQHELVTKFTLEDRDRFIGSIRKAMMEQMEDFANLEFEETGYGRIEDKIQKNTGAVMLSQGTEAIPQNMYASDKGLTVEYYAPYGVIGAVTPVTNPAATVVGNGIACIAAGNAVIFNAHPNGKRTSGKAVQELNKAITAAGGPANLLSMPANPDLETLDEIMASPVVKLLVGTGGPGMVATLMKSGKKVIAAGAGNPPSIIDETADLPKAASGVYGSSSFDNNLLCIAEKEMFVVDAIYDRFLRELQAVGARLLTAEEAEKVTRLVILTDPRSGEQVINKKYVGKCTNVILADAGIQPSGDPHIAIFEAAVDHPLVQIEQMMPVIPVVRSKDFAQAMAWAVETEHDCKHSASIWSRDIYRVTAFGTAVNTTIFVQNGGTMAAFGLGGSGTNAPTIATPTGEGVTGPQTFTRRRRFCMADGGNYLL
ncbi:MAG TPA: aldehyde dehydrogenase [Pseudoflavonifractor sp.]|nr:aldehyde dehydrogenase [Pseudoflavonifractor sp.]